MTRPIFLSVVLVVAAGLLCDASEPRVLTARETERALVAGPRPHYPVRARLSRLSGSGVFRLLISKTGEVTEVRVLKSTGHRVLDEKAVEAFRRWRFKPGAVTHADIPISFKLW